MFSADVLLAAARWVNLLGVLSVFGLAMADVTGTAGRWRPGDPLMLAAAAAAALVMPVWLVLQAGEMSGAVGLAEMVSAVPAVLLHTGFGRALLLRLALLACVVLLAFRHGLLARVASVVLAVGACAVQIDMGHAAAPDGPWQRLAAVSHVLAAGAWIGGLVPLIRGLGDEPLRARQLAHRFSLLGTVAVAVLGGSAVVQACILVGGLPGLLGTGYGHALLLKTGLFAVLLAFAAFHRFALAPELAGDNLARTTRRLRRSVALEAAVGAVAVAVAAWLAGLAPGAHEQPLWPLRWQPSADAWDNPDIADRVIAGLVFCAAALAAAAAAWRWRLRRPLRTGLAASGLAALSVAAVLIVPALGAFAVPAYPTSFFESPTGFTKASVAAGKTLYDADCASCHGVRGFGDGPAAVGPARPAPLTGFHLLGRSDGEMFWILSAGLPAGAMPGFATSLSEEQRWVVVDYVRFLAGAEPAAAATSLHRHH